MPCSATSRVWWATAAVCCAVSAARATASATSLADRRASSIIRIWRSAPAAISPMAWATSDVARPDSSEVAAISWEAAVTCPAEPDTRPTISLRLARVSL